MTGRWAGTSLGPRPHPASVASDNGCAVPGSPLTRLDDERDPAFVGGLQCEAGVMAELPEFIDLDGAFRAAFYLVRQYVERESAPDEGLVLLLQYLWTDPARWSDWQSAVVQALADDGVANPNHDGVWQERPPMP